MSTAAATLIGRQADSDSAVVSIPVVASARDSRIDFLRGLLLIIVFIEHAPRTVFYNFTPAALSLSTCSEAFVFTSGYVSALAFGRTFDRYGFLQVLKRAWKRCAELYVWHVATLLATWAVLSAAGLEGHLRPPARPFESLLLLQWLPDLFTILVVYILLVGAIPLYLPSLLRWPTATMAASAALYSAVQIAPEPFDRVASIIPTDWANVFAWQVLFVLGGWFGVRTLRKHEPVTGGKLLLVLSIVVCTASSAYKILGYLARSGHFEAELPLPDKYHLSPFRILSFLALAWVLLWVRNRYWNRIPDVLTKFTIRCGRNSLQVFSVHNVLAYLAIVAIAWLGTSFVAQLAVVLGGIAVILASGTYFDWRKAR